MSKNNKKIWDLLIGELSKLSVGEIFDKKDFDAKYGCSYTASRVYINALTNIEFIKKQGVGRYAVNKKIKPGLRW